MLLPEALWLAARLSGYGPQLISPLINIGSGSQSFREIGQSFISQNLIRPLEMSGVSIFHLDIEDAEGVDLVGDIMDASVISEVRSMRPRSLLLANVLEHVKTPSMVAEVCVDLLEPGGLIAVSVPYDFPYHLAPIDNLLRPTPDELAALFPNCAVIASEVVISETFGEQLIKSPTKIIKHLLRMVIPWPTHEHRKAANDRNKWLFRHYRTSCAILMKQ